MMDEEPARKRRRKGAAFSSSPTTPDPIEIAMEAIASGRPPQDTVLDLIRNQNRLIGWQILKERAGFGLRVLTGLVGFVLAAALGSLVWSASQERGLVIEPFSVPPEFAERGVTGQVVASRLLDRLGSLNDQTYSVREPSTYANNWNGDIKVQIPQTGISVGELRRYLVDWLGKQTTVSGELYRTPDGLSLVARAGTATATPQTGPDERALDAMIQAAAEQIYATTQPYRYALWLRQQADTPETKAAAIAALEALTRSDDQIDRLWAYAGLSVAFQERGDFQGSVRVCDTAIALDPRFNVSYRNRADSLLNMGHDEAAYLAYLEAYRIGTRYGRRFMRPDILSSSMSAALGQANLFIGDYPSVAAGTKERLTANPGDFDGIYQLAMAQAGAHDTVASRATLATKPPGAPAFINSLDAARAATLSGEWGEVVRQLTSIGPDEIPPELRAVFRVQGYPDLAIALARLGDTHRAGLVIAGTPTDCYRCLNARAVVAEVAGDRAGADRWFNEAMRQASSLPLAHAERGRARLVRGDPEGALADFREAHRRSPNWADPIKGWGDVLLTRGDPGGAARKYAAAAERAPRWGQLHLAWGRALEAVGKRDEAIIKYRAAAGMDLSAADRSEVVRRRASVDARP